MPQKPVETPHSLLTRTKGVAQRHPPTHCASPMAREGVRQPMRGRRAGAAAGFVLVALVATACGSSGTHTQSPPTSSPPPTSSLPDSPTSPAPSESSVPPDYGTAQPAVDA